MKRKFLWLLCTVLCIGLLGCDDEFGSLNLFERWYIAIPKGIVNKVFVKNENESIDLRRGSDSKIAEINVPKEFSTEKYVLFLLDESEQLVTRRNYLEDVTFGVVFLDGETEEINQTIEIPYLATNDNWKLQQFSFRAKRDSLIINYGYAYYFFRTI